MRGPDGRSRSLEGLGGLALTSLHSLRFGIASSEGYRAPLVQSPPVPSPLSPSAGWPKAAAGRLRGFHRCGWRQPSERVGDRDIRATTKTLATH